MRPVQLLMILVALVALWTIVMRPARKQQQRVQELQRALEVGQEVVLTSGIFGTIVQLEDNRARLEVAPGTVITVARQAVVRRAESLTPDHSAPDQPADPPTPPEAEDRGETQ